MGIPGTNLVVAYNAAGRRPRASSAWHRSSRRPRSAFAGIPLRAGARAGLAAATALRALAVALTVGLIAVDGPIRLLVPLVLIESGAGAIGRSLQIGLQPLLARSPAELVSRTSRPARRRASAHSRGPASSGVLVTLVGPVGAYLAVLAVYALAVAALAACTSA